MESNMLVGSLVQAKNGRDEGDYFIVIKIENDDYVYIVNGKNRTILKPKKKKLKHLKFLGVYSDELNKKITSGNKLLDSDIRNAIKTCIK